MSEIPAGEQTSVPNPAELAKQQTARSIVRTVQALAPINDSGPDAWQLYFDTTAAHGAYEDADLAALGMTAQQLIDCVTLLEQFKNFCNDADVLTAAYRVTINSVRHLQV